VLFVLVGLFSFELLLLLAHDLFLLLGRLLDLLVFGLLGFNPVLLLLELELSLGFLHGIVLSLNLEVL